MKSVQWEPSCSKGTDEERHDEVNSRLSQFCESAKKKTGVTVAPSQLQCLPYPDI